MDANRRDNSFLAPLAFLAFGFPASETFASKLALMGQALRLMLSLRGGGAAATGACTGCAAVAMPGGGDAAMVQFGQVKRSNVMGRGSVRFQLEHLVEVTIIEATVPTHGNRVAAHQS